VKVLLHIEHWKYRSFFIGIFANLASMAKAKAVNLFASVVTLVHGRVVEIVSDLGIVAVCVLRVGSGANVCNVCVVHCIVHERCGVTDDAQVSDPIRAIGSSSVNVSDLIGSVGSVDTANCLAGTACNGTASSVACLACNGTVVSCLADNTCIGTIDSCGGAGKALNAIAVDLGTVRAVVLGTVGAVDLGIVGAVDLGTVGSIVLLVISLINVGSVCVVCCKLQIQFGKIDISDDLLSMTLFIGLSLEFTVACSSPDDCIVWSNMFRCGIPSTGSLCGD
jgi:hypothetical protein